MAWASSGGYPGVTSNGPGALLAPGGIEGGSVLVSNGKGLVVFGSTFPALLLIERSLNNDGLALANGVGLFGHTPPAAATVGGAATAGGTYTAAEEAMLNAVYTALRSIGLIT